MDINQINESLMQIEPSIVEDANELGTVYKLNKELVLKQGGSVFNFPKGTVVAMIPTGKNKFSAANSNTETTVDALSGSISPSVFKKVSAAGKPLGSIPANNKLLRRTINKNFLAGPIGKALK